MNSWISRNLFLWPATRIRGERINHYLKLYRKHQWLLPTQIQTEQFRALLPLLRWAQQSSRFHRARIEPPRSWDPESAADALLGMPTMTKADLTERLPEISTSEPNIFVTRKTTGGSTGQPVTVLKDADALARERAATYRSYEWAGLLPGDPQARFWGVPHSKGRRLFYVLADIIANRKRFSAFGYDEQILERYYRGLVTFKPRYLYGYVSMLRHLADFMLETSRPPLRSVRAIITTSEVLTDADRSMLRKAFNAPVYNEYGCGEVGSIAHECERGSLHVMAENLIVELLDEKDRPTNEGEIVVTDLHNRVTPLIRYRLGDFAATSESVCPCGRGLPTLQRVYGRAYDTIETPERLRLHPEAIVYIFEILKDEGAPVKQFQVEQTQLTELVVRLVADPSFSSAHERRLLDLLRLHVSPNFHVRISHVTSIPREPSGKLRVVKRSFSAHS
jgi:phenylacetate-CoA ligase